MESSGGKKSATCVSCQEKGAGINHRKSFFSASHYSMTKTHPEGTYDISLGKRHKLAKNQDMARGKNVKCVLKGTGFLRVKSEQHWNSDQDRGNNIRTSKRVFHFQG